MSTEPKYLDDTYCFQSEANVTDFFRMGGSTEVYFDKTIFYPQGGGQPSDTGFILIDGEKYSVTSVEFRDGNIVHHITGLSISNDLVKKNVIQSVDERKRIENAKAHTAGHLITHILETINPDFLPAKGHHFPDGSYVELLDEKRQGNGELLEEANSKLQLSIDEGLNITATSCSFNEIEKVRPFLAQYVPKDKPTRMLTIGKFIPVPCGGTHVRNTSEINGLVITRIRRKKNRLKVNYEFS